MVEKNNQKSHVQALLGQTFAEHDITYHCCQSDAGNSFILIQRLDIIRCLRLISDDAVSGLVMFQGEETIGFDRNAIPAGLLKSNAIKIGDQNLYLVLCDSDPDGSWFNRFALCPLPVVWPSQRPGGSFSDGTFVGPDFIAFVPDGAQLKFETKNLNVPVEAVDAVYMWVTSDDVKWRLKKARSGAVGVIRASDNEYRYLSREELRYSLRSLRMHAPWIRRIYLVTDDQVPVWVKDHEDLVVVDHKEIFENPNSLPTYNSRAIAANLHHIEGLSEHFICFNDDVFLGKPTQVSDFFDNTGRPRMFYSGQSTIDKNKPDSQKNPVELAADELQRVMLKEYGFMPMRKIRHVPFPLRRSFLYEIEQRFPVEFSITANAKLRGANDIAVPSMLFPYFAWVTGRALATAPSEHNYVYFDTGKEDSRFSMSRILRDPPHFFCANSTENYEISVSEQQTLLSGFLKKMYPKKSEFEK